MTSYGLSVFDQHAEMLAASGITPEHARARGYVSVDTKTRLDPIGVTKAGRRVPGLLVPSLRADGSVWGYQYRPDSPRERGGKPVKYETPVDQRNGIDVPPGVGPMLADPAVPLWITEGVKKADAGALAGLCIVALPGVWSWRGRNDRGGKVAVGDWHDIALNDRRVVLAFDGDVSRKRSVRSALDALAKYLRTKGAQVEYLHLPDEDDKVGLDDFLVSGHTVDDLRALIRPNPPEPSKLPDDPAPVSPAAPEAPVTPEGGDATGAETGALLDEIRSWLDEYVRTMHERDLDLLTLWAAHTHLVVETYTTPRLVLDSPVPGAGKTTTLEHLERLCVAPVQAASLSSPALLTRMLDAGMRTILIDEADRSLNPEKDGVAELLAVLNSGYKRGATRPVLVPATGGKWSVAEMPTYSPVVMAGNNPQLPEDTRSRCIRVLLLPDHGGTVAESDWELIDPDARRLGSRLATWADQVREDVRTHRPPLPEGITGRFREKWSPLNRIAAAAGGRWPEAVAALAIHDKEQSEMDREDGLIRDRPAVVLLKHLHALWDDGVPFKATSTLTRELADQYPDDWGHGSPFGKPITAQRFGKMLATAYGINSTRLDREGPRGYARAALEPVWRSMGISAPAATPVYERKNEDCRYPREVSGEGSAPDAPLPLGVTGATGASGETGAPAEIPCERCGSPNPDHRTRAYCPGCWTALTQDQGVTR